jgi:hypothetical protein
MTSSSWLHNIQPDPRSNEGYKKRTARSGTISLPTTVSNPAIVILGGNVRRSSRINKTDGFHAVHIDREPAKKRKTNILQIDEQTGCTGLVSLSVL